MELVPIQRAQELIHLQIHFAVRAMQGGIFLLEARPLQPGFSRAPKTYKGDFNGPSHTLSNYFVAVQSAAAGEAIKS
jgi:hypothetical protein